MTIKSIIALFMGLVIQFSQVQSSLATAPVKSCGDGPSMSCCCCCCCEGLQSCPCAKEADPDQKPAPLIPAAGDLKWIVSRASEPAGLDELIFPQTEAVVSTGSQMDGCRAFAGVPLSVAFCRFVI